MRSSVFLSAAFAVTALTSPVMKRDVEVVTDVDVVYVTQWVTETAGSSATSTSAEATTSVAAVAHYGHHTHSSSSSVVESSAAAPTSVKVFHLLQKVIYFLQEDFYFNEEGHYDYFEEVFYHFPQAFNDFGQEDYHHFPQAFDDFGQEDFHHHQEDYFLCKGCFGHDCKEVVVHQEAYNQREDATSSAAPTTSKTSTKASSTSATATKPSTYQETVLVHHNVHRANHSAPALVWDSYLEETAAEVAASCVYAHDMTKGTGGYGQNIAAGVEASNVSAVITDLFYNGEVNWYNGLYGEAQPDMTNFEHWGHFSQIVWVGTTKVACVTQDCSSSGLANVGSDVAPYFTVCNYGDPGNYANEYGANVLSPLDHSTVDWSYDL
ncbi:hypothetical protein M8818_006082 [Zalaria obscura]|uniref:Uncharacterized protein n=1 Tax=Zalaria obscura TaxID=2024903 RepID=A0ACC3S7J3_9PEZI